MVQLILGLVYAAVDIVRAVWDLLCRRPRGAYVASAVARAPRELVWSIIQRRDVTYAINDMRVVTTPLEEHGDVLRSQFLLGGREAMAIAYREHDLVEPETLRLRYVPEFSTAAHAIGTDDDVRIDLAALPDGHTRITYTREVTHDRAATRISAPVGVRQAVLMTRTQAEHEAGVRAARAPLWHQLVWALLAFVSFAWLLDWRLALAMMAIIAIHELGHALAMLWYGLGVSVVTFVPFLGGVAAPKRPYQTEVQRVVVALMGVGLSLPLSLAAVAVAGALDAPNLALLAMLSLIINGLNLVPFPGLDGSVVLSILLSKLHKSLNHAATILMFGLFVALGIILRDPLVWIAIALSFVSVVQVMSLKIDDHLVKLGRLGVAGVIFAYIGLVGAHVAAFHWASETATQSATRIVESCLGETTDRSRDIATCAARARLWLLDPR